MHVPAYVCVCGLTDMYMPQCVCLCVCVHVCMFMCACMCATGDQAVTGASCCHLLVSSTVSVYIYIYIPSHWRPCQLCGVHAMFFNFVVVVVVIIVFALLFRTYGRRWPA